MPPMPDDLITPAELDAIEARANAATDGPWYVRNTDDDHCMSGSYVGTERGPGEGHDGLNGLAIGGNDPATVVAITCIQAPLLAMAEREEENALFIAAARADIPRLVATVRELWALLREGWGYANTEDIDPLPLGEWESRVKTALGEPVPDVDRWLLDEADDRTQLVTLPSNATLTRRSDGSYWLTADPSVRVLKIHKGNGEQVSPDDYFKPELETVRVLDGFKIEVAPAASAKNLSGHDEGEVIP